MNSMIENLVIDMRALGIKSLALELSDDSGSPAIATSEGRATLAPDALRLCGLEHVSIANPELGPVKCALPLGHEGHWHDSDPGGDGVIRPRVEWDDRADLEPEFRGDPNQCAHEGCGEPNGGIFGGKQRQFCRKHAFLQLGIK